MCLKTRLSRINCVIIVAYCPANDTKKDVSCHRIPASMAGVGIVWCELTCLNARCAAFRLTETVDLWRAQPTKCKIWLCLVVLDLHDRA